MGKHKIEDGNSLSDAQIERRVQECDCVIMLNMSMSNDILEGIKAVLATGLRVVYAHRYPEQTVLLIKDPKKGVIKKWHRK